jgi:hypothetical protein
MTEQIKLAISRLHPGQLALLWVVFGVLVGVGLWQYQAAVSGKDASLSKMESFGDRLTEDFARFNAARAVGDIAILSDAERANITSHTRQVEASTREYNYFSRRERWLQKGVWSLGVLFIALVGVTWTWSGLRLQQTPAQH